MFVYQCVYANQFLLAVEHYYQFNSLFSQTFLFHLMQPLGSSSAIITYEWILMPVYGSGGLANKVEIILQAEEIQ